MRKSTKEENKLGKKEHDAERERTEGGLVCIRPCAADNLLALVARASCMASLSSASFRDSSSTRLRSSCSVW